MKDKFWGLKKEEVDRFMRRMEREIQFEIQKLEFELVTTKKENERLLEQIQEREEEQTTINQNKSFWEHAKTRLTTVISLLNSQKEKEINSLKEESNERLKMYQMEISKLEKEIHSINQIIGKFLSQIDLNPKYDDVIMEEDTIGTPVIEKMVEKHPPLSLQLKGSMEEILSDKIAEVEQKNEESFDLNEPAITIKEKIISYQQENQPSPLFLQEIQQELPSKERHATTKEDPILNQILSFKEHYLNGKVTGKDLYNQSGKLLIPVNTQITKDMVDLANQEGKLAELIVNMKVPGVGEE